MPGRFDFDKPIPEPSWLVEGLIPQGDLSFLLAHSGSGKSFWLEALAVSTVFNQDFCGIKSKGGSVLIIDEDTPTDVLYSRLSRFGRAFNSSPKHDLIVRSMEGLTLSSGRLMAAINDANATLTIVDSFNRICGSYNPNNTRDMDKLAYLKAECLRSDSTIMFAHHISEKIPFTIEELMSEQTVISGMGNSAIKQQADTEYILAPETSKQKLEKIYICPRPKRHAISTKPFIFKLVEPTSMSYRLDFIGFYDPEMREVAKDILLLFLHSPGNYTIKEIRELMGHKWGEKSVREGATSLEQDGYLNMSRHRSNLFKYSPSHRLEEFKENAENL